MRVLTLIRTTLNVRGSPGIHCYLLVAHGFESSPGILDPTALGLAATKSFLLSVRLLTSTYIYREQKLKSVLLGRCDAQGTCITLWGERGHCQAEVAAAGSFTISKRVPAPPGQAVPTASFLTQYPE